MLKSFLPVLLATGLCAASPPGLAHHAFSAEFDANQPIEVKGVVTRGRWVNPHSWLYIDVKDASGTVTNWGFEFGAPFALEQKGLTKHVLQAGTEVLIRGFKAKSGKPFGYASTLTLPDGRSFKTGGAGDSPEVQSAPRAQ